MDYLYFSDENDTQYDLVWIVINSSTRNDEQRIKEWRILSNTHVEVLKPLATNGFEYFKMNPFKSNAIDMIFGVILIWKMPRIQWYLKERMHVFAILHYLVGSSILIRRSLLFSNLQSLLSKISKIQINEKW